MRGNSRRDAGSATPPCRAAPSCGWGGAGGGGEGGSAGTGHRPRPQRGCACPSPQRRAHRWAAALAQCSRRRPEQVCRKARGRRCGKAESVLLPRPCRQTASCPTPHPPLWPCGMSPRRGPGLPSDFQKHKSMESVKGGNEDAARRGRGEHSEEGGAV